ncbi:MAG: thermonuclease family protein [Rhodobacter sp.]|nr:thermonuclease family protein [Rhodobacter sp.]
MIRETVYQGRSWVIDGDTIDIEGTRIRLAGIDAPELEDPYGKQARSALIRLCHGAEMRAVAEGEQTHVRLVATCYLPDGRDLSAEMVKAGLAIDWPKFSSGKVGEASAPKRPPRGSLRAFSKSCGDAKRVAPQAPGDVNEMPGPRACSI